MARILLVDDNPFVQQVLAQLLTVLGHEVVQAGDGRQALAHLRRERYDAILTDVLMPEIDGLEVLRCAARYHPVVPRHSTREGMPAREDPRSRCKDPAGGAGPPGGCRARRTASRWS